MADATTTEGRDNRRKVREGVVSSTKMDKTAITRLVRINWRTVGAIIERVVADELDPHRLDGLFEVDRHWGLRRR